MPSDTHGLKLFTTDQLAREIIHDIALNVLNQEIIIIYNEKRCALSCTALVRSSAAHHHPTLRACHMWCANELPIKDMYISIDYHGTHPIIRVVTPVISCVS